MSLEIGRVLVQTGLMAFTVAIERVLPRWLFPSKFPYAVEGLTKWWPWIDRQLGLPRDAAIIRREITPVDLIDSCNSSWARVAIEYREASGRPATTRARFKFAPLFSTWKEAMFFGLSCQPTAEVAFYQRYAPTATCRSPRCYGAFVSPLLVRMCVIQEELEGVHLEELDKDPNALEHARLSIVALAKLHARFWRSTYPPAALRKGSLHTRPFWPVALKNVERHQKTGKVPSGRASEPGGPLVPLFRHLLKQSLRLPITYIHGDFRRGNVVIVATAAGSEACLIDWAVSRWGSAAFDVAFYLTMSLTVGDHAGHEGELLELYYATWLAERGGAGDGYPFEQLYDDYLLGSLLTVLALSVPGMQGEVILNEHNYVKCLTSGILWGNRILDLAPLVDFARLETLLRPMDERLTQRTIMDIWNDAGTRVRDGSADLLAEWQAKVAVRP